MHLKALVVMKQYIVLKYIQLTFHFAPTNMSTSVYAFKRRCNLYFCNIQVVNWKDLKLRISS